jgi:phosphodiesterase/alkaline phosphatase D-like protein
MAETALLNSRATWKVIASDMPLSIVVYDDAANKTRLRKRLRRATARRAAANWRSPTCCASSRHQASSTRSG